MGGWLHHLALSARARTGFSTHIVVWAIIAAVSSATMFVFLCVAAFVWLADRYGAVTAGLVMAGSFFVITLIAVVSVIISRRRTIERARIELAARGINPDTPEDTTTAEHFLADQHAGLAEDDRHRQLTGEHELTDVAQQRDAELRVIQPEPPTDAADTNVPDIRDIAAREPRRPAQAEDDWTRIPTASETADNVTLAQRALAELEQRRHIEQRRNDEEARSRQLADWHHHNRTADQAKQRQDDRALDRT
jgi:hypothetical protein